MRPRSHRILIEEQTVIRSLLPLLLTLAVTACGGAHRLPEASGPWRALNAGRWVPVAEDLRGPRAPLPPALSPSLVARGAGA